ncbi:hypothetical protein [Candidatus Finniella inopinata]|uniref:Uncharacterized protein n=1 Tax=Candidatus Finniella inopinata TaxID=1696036 RepID=A0A4Q7DEJ9_9PROT|nr:hypothetical protein [Candidatus Finniella inopinata]RZI45093.1 hypothetical protein EQU50_08300 [Candidatus Finniella inopinata]
METKQCSTCKREKTMDQFKTKRDGSLTKGCLACRNKQRMYRKQDASKIKEEETHEIIGEIIVIEEEEEKVGEIIVSDRRRGFE